ncbi:MAG TPA: 4Fe-4S binding protein [Candidatus Gastranaerophilales bacterium]|nr:4Fe-4S binding protein [Candidatus Gastranaerophilales bacterium]
MAKELVVISGKGGTGKTSIVVSFSALAQNHVMVDCDVDAADMHLILHPEIEKTVEFYSGKQAEILTDKCKKCGRCIEVCKFDAISKDFMVDEIKCEGCGACYFNCPHQAVKFEQVKSGEWFESNTRFGKLIHAKLDIAEENSGKLVSEIKNHARILAKKDNKDLILVDGSPGIGCPVIASISGANLVLIVTEPTLSGIHDAERVFQLTQHFKIPASMCINKYDLNLQLTEQIESYCKGKNIPVVGKIPYSRVFTDAMIKGLSVVEYSNSEVSEKIKKMWDKVHSEVIKDEKQYQK